MFAMFLAVEITALSQLTNHSIDDVFGLMTFLFVAFWALGWSVGVVILGLLTALFLFYKESARLQGNRLVHVPRLGPLNIALEYDLAKVRNLRLEPAGSGDRVRLAFDYNGGASGLGDAMPRSDAERLMRTIQRSASVAALTSPQPPIPTPRPPIPNPATPIPNPQSPVPAPSVASPSGIALIAANLLPLAGVVFLGWDLAEIVLLYWAESAVIAFYTALKMAVVGKLLAVVSVPFFLAHFGGFMAMHFLFIYMFFIRGIAASGPEPAALEALRTTFVPLWVPLAALVVSHGVSFRTNFLGRREHASTTMNALMTAPYNRIIVMHLTLIVGGWIILGLGSTTGALALLIVIKTFVDFTAHRKEHRRF
jgi:hypothetical protein